MSTTVHSSAGLDDGLLEQVRTALASSTSPASPARVAAALRATGTVLGDAAILEITKALRAELSGAGPLDGLLHEPGVTDVLVNGPSEVWVDRGSGLERAGVRFRDDAAVRTLAQRLAASAGRRLDDAMPFVDARLPGRVRLHAVLPPVTPQGTVISLRVPAPHTFTLHELVENGSVAPDLLPWLTAVLGARLAFLVSGGTGSGKTTALGSLLSLADPAERLVLVEDSGELTPDHPHVVRLEARPANVEGAGRVGLDQLVRQALRMRPDRIVVGEVRGPEVVDLLVALNTGHEGGCATLHANSAADVPARLEALGLTAGMSRAAVHAQAASAVDVVMHLERLRSGQRVLAQLHVVDRDAAGAMVTVPAFHRGADGRAKPGAGQARLRELLAARGWLP